MRFVYDFKLKVQQTESERKKETGFQSGTVAPSIVTQSLHVEECRTEVAKAWRFVHRQAPELEALVRVAQAMSKVAPRAFIVEVAQPTKKAGRACHITANADLEEMKQVQLV